MAQLIDDCFAYTEPLMRLDVALNLIAERIVPVIGTQDIELHAALGRFLACDLFSSVNVPPHANSAVDGYAVFFDDLNSDSETELPVIGRVTAGHPFREAMRRGTAIRIFTGAMLPEGADTVMMQEDCREQENGVIIRPGIACGANCRAAGEDVQAGHRILKAGRRLQAQDIGLAASVGYTRLPVYLPLRVGLFSTGDELRSPDTDLSPGMVYDANRFALAAALQGLGMQVRDFGIIPDDRAILAAAFEQAISEQDLILTSGGVSAGEEDHVRAAIESLGGVIHFWRLAIKPGRPITMGQLGDVPLIGLPGNPVAALVTFWRLVRPLILRLAGGSEESPLPFRVRVNFNHHKKPDRREWVRASLALGPDGVPELHKFPRDGAGILSSLVESDGLIELPEELTELQAGAYVDFLPFNSLVR